MNIVDFDLPKTDVNGNLLDVNNMYYNFFCDKEVFTFYADEYFPLAADGIDEMTDVPYTFTDAWEYLIIGGEGVAHSLSYFFEDAESIGFQLFYKDEDGTVLASDYVGYELSKVDNAITAKEISTVNYYDIQGRQVVSPSNGLYVKAVVFKDGSVQTTKIAIK